ncbi:MAG: hypothetical protein ABIR53_03435, partial [Paraperlucidibaca sp.]
MSEQYREPSSRWIDRWRALPDMKWWWAFVLPADQRRTIPIIDALTIRVGILLAAQLGVPQPAPLSL